MDRRREPGLIFRVPITVIASILFAFAFLKRHKTIAKITILVFIALIALYQQGGVQAMLILFQFAIQMVMAVAFMIVQFAALFWFISRTKATEIHPGDPKSLSWSDYWGNEHIVKMVRQWASLLTGRMEFEEMGGKTLNGLLLVGPPGTGKTMMAKCLAGDAGCAFYGMEGSGFRAMFWGVDIMKVMGFFRKGRKLAKIYGACILFLDEIDAIGMSRRGGAGGQVAGRAGGLFGGMMGSGALNRLLYEMDGIEDVPLFDQCKNKVRLFLGYSMIDQGRVMVLGSTNIPEVLDEALLRPGRFDRKILVDLPDKHSRRLIIEGYLGKIKHDDNIDIDSLVQDTPSATPAHIMSAITKDAVRLALFDDRNSVSQRDIEDAFQEQMLGIANPISELEPEQKWQIAVHESGHTLAQYFLKPKERIVRVSIVRRAGALGYMLPARLTDVYTLPLTEFVASIRIALAGHVATEVALGEPWTGAGGDIEHVKHYIYFLAQHGVFGSLPVDMGGGMTGHSYDQKTRDSIENFLREQLKATRALLEKNEAALLALAHTLVEKDDLTGAEAVQIIEEAIGEKRQPILDGNGLGGIYDKEIQMSQFCFDGQ